MPSLCRPPQSVVVLRFADFEPELEPPASEVVVLLGEKLYNELFFLKWFEADLLPNDYGDLGPLVEERC